MNLIAKIFGSRANNNKENKDNMSPVSPTDVITKWIEAGKPSPPPHLYKQIVIKEFASRFRLPIFVETGTYLGEMIEACKQDFREVKSIELSEQFYKDAQKKFAHDNHIQLFQGDSADTLPEILKTVEEPCLFWLDGHYSCGATAKGKLNTPIMDELKAIFAHPLKTHVILIDDARCFVVNDPSIEELKDYPTQQELKAYIASENPNLAFEVADDIIRIYPNQDQNDI